MAIANITTDLNADLETVWNIVTSLTEYEWRSDISRIEIIEPDKKFIEYTEDGYATEFCITSFEPQKRYEFDMNNSNMSGHWTGLFSEQNGMVHIDFTEDVTAKKLILRPFVKGYLKKQQAQYISDLQKKISGNPTHDKK